MLCSTLTLGWFQTHLNTSDAISDNDVPIHSVTRFVSEICPSTLFIDARREGEADLSAATVLKAGPRAVLTDRPLSFVNSSNVTVLDAPNLIETLKCLASSFRQSFKAIGVGITGSVGKTTTTLMIHTLLGEQDTLSTLHNENDELGIPVLAFGLKHYHKYFVAEIGTWRLGEVGFCADVVVPRVGVITNIGWAHLARFGTRENIAQAKGELARRMSGKDLIVLNRDDDYAASIARSTNAEVGWFSTRQLADASLLSLSLYPHKSVFRARIDGEEQTFTLPLPGEHNVANALAAILVARRLGENLSIAAMRLENFKLSEPGRLEYIECGDVTILDDSYNASPSSVQALSLVLSREPLRPRIVVFGGMSELGESSLKLHLESVVALAKSCEVLILFGEVWNQWMHFPLPRNAFIASDNHAAIQLIVTVVQPRALLAFKGSRNTQTWMLVQRIIRFLSPF
jgi:UDP-N-acetylmuramoyl-tripeptide--D-alanyl-D-alanine ligase